MMNILSTTITLLFFFSAFAQNNNPTIGIQYINSAELVEKYIDADSEKKEKIEDIQAELSKHQDDYEKIAELFRNGNESMEDLRRAKSVEQQIKELRLEYRQILTEVVNDIKLQIDFISNENSFDIILDLYSIDDDWFVVGSKELFSVYGHNINPLILENLNIPHSNNKTPNTTGNFGYIEVEQIIRLMPEYAKGTAKLEQLSKEYETEMSILVEDLTKKMEEDTITYEEATAQKSTLEEYQSVLTKNLEDEQNRIFSPIIASVKNSCQMVANAKNISIVID